jgi:hypothetical protein
LIKDGTIGTSGAKVTDATSNEGLLADGWGLSSADNRMPHATHCLIAAFSHFILIPIPDVVLRSSATLQRISHGRDEHRGIRTLGELKRGLWAISEKTARIL